MGKVWTRETLNSRDATERVLNERLALIQCLHQSTLPLQIWPFIWTLSKSKNHGRESRAHQRMITTSNSYVTRILCLVERGRKVKEWKKKKKNWIDLARWLLIICSASTGRLSTISHEIYSIAKSWKDPHKRRKNEIDRWFMSTQHHILICFCAWVANAVLFVVFLLNIFISSRDWLWCAHRSAVQSLLAGGVYCPLRRFFDGLV